jgi:hypothetical protein
VLLEGLIPKRDDKGTLQLPDVHHQQDFEKQFIAVK